MKLALATLATTIALATGASAMTSSYDRAVNNNEEGLINHGIQTQKVIETHSDSPQAEYAVEGQKEVTAFSTDASDQHQFNGYEGR
ncbi:MAG: hypothetical protein HLUCCO07_12040 [Rhodobacteraceae bacterium HLUCCO07]|nr:MAG: hypothetical protein HLUCCO07_12040 [Rhodobacteraceae bacterium HLUCCO07]